MKKRLLSLGMAALMAMSVMACGGAKETADKEVKEDVKEEAVLPNIEADESKSGKVMLYSSMQEDQLIAIKDAFKQKYPNIDMDYYYAGTGKVITKIATEHQSGHVVADVIWVGNPSDYIGFKEEGILAKYSSPEAEGTIDPKFIDPEGYYTGARMMNIGIGYNTTLVTEEEAPKNWDDLLDEKWNNQIIMTDPSTAGTTKFAVGAFMCDDNYGKEFFEKLKANGCELESGTTATHNQVAAAAYKVGIMLDYVTENLKAQGSPINFIYPEKDIISMTSPLGLVEGAENEENGKLLYDFILSKEGQEVLVANNLLSVRNDVQQIGVDPDEISAHAMDAKVSEIADRNDEIVADFDAIFK